MCVGKTQQWISALGKPRKKVEVADVLYAFLSAHERMESEPVVSAGGAIADIVSGDKEADAQGEDEFVAAMLSDGFDGDLAILAALEEGLGLSGDAHDVGADMSDAAACGAAVFGEGDDVAASAPVDAPSEAPVPDVVAALVSADSVFEESTASSPGASSSTDPPPIAHAAASPLEGPLCDITAMGYVRRPGEERPIGLIGHSHGGKTIFGNCHRHLRCSVQAGVVRQPLPR